MGECDLWGKATDFQFFYVSNTKAMVWHTQLVSITLLCDLMVMSPDQLAPWKELECRNPTLECRQGVDWLGSSALAKPEASGVDAEAGKWAFSAWLPAGSLVGRQKRVDQESRKGVRQEEKKITDVPSFHNFIKIFSMTHLVTFPKNLIW